MSQTSLLADLATWSREECEKQVDQVLPRVVQCLQSTTDVQKQTEITQLICQSFLPVITKQTQHLVLSVIHLASESVDNGLIQAEKLATLESGFAVQSATQHITDVLQSCVSLVSCIATCVSQLTPTTDSVDMADLVDVPMEVINVMQHCFTHCRDSSTIYGTLLSVLSQHLALLFRHTAALQTTLIALLDKVCISKQEEDNVQHMVTAIHGLFMLTQVTARLEVKVMLGLWKCVSRLACLHKELLGGQLNINEMISHLCSDISATYTYMFNSHTATTVKSSGFSKTCKVLGFQLRMLHMLCKEYGNSLRPDTLTSVYSLILVLLSKVRPAPEANSYPVVLVEEVEREVTAGVEPLVKLLIPVSKFTKCVLTHHKHSEDLQSCKQWLPHLLTLVTVMDHLPLCTQDTQTAWIKPASQNAGHMDNIAGHQGLLPAVFEAFRACYVALCKPVFITVNIKERSSQQSVSLYTYIATRVCGFTACVGAREFNEVEHALLQAVLGCCKLTAQLAVDVWCFIARYGTADVCRDHVLLIAHLLTQSANTNSTHSTEPSIQTTTPNIKPQDSELTSVPTLSPTLQTQHLVLLLRRLLFFLAVEQQAELSLTYPVSSNLVLWSVVPLSVFTPAHLQALTDELVTKASRMVEIWLSSEQRSVGLARGAVTAINVLCNVSSHVIERSSDQQHKTTLTTLCTCLLSDTLTAPRPQFPPLQAVLCAVLRLTAALMHHLEDTAVTTAISSLCHLLGTENNNKRIHPVSASIKLHILLVLRSLTHRAPGRFLGDVPSLYHMLLCDANPALHHAALAAFARFAEETPHEGAVSETLQDDTRLQEAVVAYLDHHQGAAPETGVEQLEQQAECVGQSALKSSTELYPVPTWPTHIMMATTDDNDDLAEKNPNSSHVVKTAESLSIADRLDLCLADIKHGVSGLTEVRRHKGKLPEHIQQELQIIHLQLSELL